MTVLECIDILDNADLPMPLKLGMAYKAGQAEWEKWELESVLVMAGVAQEQLRSGKPKTLAEYASTELGLG